MMNPKNNTSENLREPKDFGIPIETNAFRSLVAEYLRRMTAGQEMNEEDCVTLTRLWNTIEFHHLDQVDDLYHDYYTTFFPGYVERVSTCLDAIPTKGMALYSKKHDIYLGGKPHARSQYALRG
jgi:hypothetical protein